MSLRSALYIPSWWFQSHQRSYKNINVSIHTTGSSLQSICQSLLAFTTNGIAIYIAYGIQTIWYTQTSAEQSHIKMVAENRETPYALLCGIPISAGHGRSTAGNYTADCTTFCKASFNEAKIMDSGKKSQWEGRRRNLIAVILDFESSHHSLAIQASHTKCLEHLTGPHKSWAVKLACAGSAA